jgi:hypothetical protein
MTAGYTGYAEVEILNAAILCCAFLRPSRRIVVFTMSQRFGE